MSQTGHCFLKIASQVKYFDLDPLTDYGDNSLDEAAVLARDTDAGVRDEICNVPIMGFSRQS